MADINAGNLTWQGKVDLNSIDKDLRAAEDKFKQSQTRLNKILAKVGIDTSAAEKELQSFAKRISAKLVITGKVQIDTSAIDAVEKRVDSLIKKIGSINGNSVTSTSPSVSAISRGLGSSYGIVQTVANTNNGSAIAASAITASAVSRSIVLAKATNTAPVLRVAASRSKTSLALAGESSVEQSEGISTSSVYLGSVRRSKVMQIKRSATSGSTFKQDIGGLPEGFETIVSPRPTKRSRFIPPGEAAYIDPSKRLYSRFTGISPLESNAGSANTMALSNEGINPDLSRLGYSFSGFGGSFSGGGGIGGTPNFPGGAGDGGRMFLGRTGLRGFFRKNFPGVNPQLARYLGAAAIAGSATHALNQYNQYRIDTAAATNTQDFINAGLNYQSNSPLANIPVAGPLGSALRETLTGDRAAIAGTMSSVNMANQSMATRQNARSIMLRGQANVAGLTGNFAGQRKSSTILTKDVVEKAKFDTAQKNTELSQAATALKENYKVEIMGRDPVTGGRKVVSTHYNPMSKKDQATYDNFQAQIKDNTNEQNRIITSANATDAQTQININRAESLSKIGAKRSIRISNLTGVDDRQANIVGIKAQYDDEINSPDAGVAARGKRKLKAALRAEARLHDHNVQMQGESNTAAQLFGTGYDLAGELASNEQQFHDRTFGMNPKDPMYQKQVDARKIADDSAKRKFELSRQEMANSNQMTSANLLGFNLDRTISAQDAMRKTEISNRPEYKAEIDKKYDLMGQETKLANGQRLAQYGLGTRSIAQKGDLLDTYNRTGSTIAVNTKGILYSAQNEIDQTNLDMSIPQSERQKRIDKIKGTAKSGLLNEKQQFRFSLSTESISAYQIAGGAGGKDETAVAEFKALQDIDKQVGQIGNLPGARADQSPNGPNGGWNPTQITDALKFLKDIADNVGITP